MDGHLVMGLNLNEILPIHYLNKNFLQGLMVLPEILEHTDLALILTPEI